MLKLGLIFSPKTIKSCMFTFSTVISIAHETLASFNVTQSTRWQREKGRTKRKDGWMDGVFSKRLQCLSPCTMVLCELDQNIKALRKKGYFKSGTCNMKKGWLKQKLGLANGSELKMKG